MRTNQSQFNPQPCGVFSWLLLLMKGLLCPHHSHPLISAKKKWQKKKLLIKWISLNELGNLWASRRIMVTNFLLSLWRWRPLFFLFGASEFWKIEHKGLDFTTLPFENPNYRFIYWLMFLGFLKSQPVQERLSWHAFRHGSLDPLQSPHHCLASASVCPPPITSWTWHAAVEGERLDVTWLKMEISEPQIPHLCSRIQAN